MARRYFNAGTAGRDHSMLILTRSRYGDYLSQAEFQIRGPGNLILSPTTVLNLEQIKDLILQLELISGIKKTENPMIEGAL